MEFYGLASLSAMLKRDKHLLDYPRRAWVHERRTSTGQNIYDSLIIGGGQSGLGAAFGLMLEKVTNILVIDENATGQEGPWLRFARMPHLRTPKHLTGLDFGNPRLTFQSFYVAKYGEQSYEKLEFIPTERWAEYLQWFRKEHDIPVKNFIKAYDIHYDEHEDCLGVHFQNGIDQGVLYARTLVLANGIEGCGAWQTPKIISNNIPHGRYAHTCETINFLAMKNQRIGVLGAGASAFDNAILALDAGAYSVHLFSRRKSLPRINPYRWVEFVGFLKHFGDLSDLMRWRFISRIIEMGQLPPKSTFVRAQEQENFHLEIGQSWHSVEMIDDEIVVHTEKGIFTFDFVIVGTGFMTDLSERPELTLISKHIALWSDRFTPPKELAHDDLARHPYLGSHYQLQERLMGTAPFLSSIFCFNFGSLLTLGLGGGSISGLKYSLPRLVQGITRKLFLDDSDKYLNELIEYDLAEYDLELPL